MDSARHILAVPYPGRGHINPMMNVCRLIATRGIQITFVVTEEWLGLLSAAPLPPNLRLRSIPNVVPSELARGADPIGFLDAVMTKMEAPFDRLLSEADCQPANAIMADTYLPWAVAVGNRRNIPVYSLFTEPAASLTIIYHNDLLISTHHVPTADLAEVGDERVECIPGIRSIRISDLHSTCFSETPLRMNTESLSWMSRAQCVLMTTFYELESHAIDALRSILPLPIYPIGPSIDLTKPNQDAGYRSWLDAQPERSVLYVSFGSFLRLPGQQMEEIAAGLRASGVRYMWVARENGDVALDGEKGIAVAWCNQVEVLRHHAVGGFFTHCGWNSTMEGLCAGVPMLAFPLMFDQFPNAKLIVDDWGVGLRAKKGGFGQESVVGRDEVAELVNTLMDLDGEESRRLRDRAAEMRARCCAAMEEGGSSLVSLDAFIRTVPGHRGDL